MRYVRNFLNTHAHKNFEELARKFQKVSRTIYADFQCKDDMGGEILGVDIVSLLLYSHGGTDIANFLWTIKCTICVH